ncbi:hypothetical protein [Celeribacter neptunius]|uniref:Uncharacterized protein n=1 Tax=Celeribacter neptunius TaxID=588602 RepID=A0A1I3NZT5_9RHOB|nr:hypothetical protein [Celeribacter neptunius]SFJ14813.1 hypothetical protein SAMN04487991_1521 [Celeribacter neptunius]
MGNAPPIVNEIVHQTDPSKGTAVLWIDTGEYHLELQLKGTPWRKTGLRPFYWELVKPGGQREWPILRIVAGRSVRITAKTSDNYGFKRIRDSSRFHLKTDSYYPIDLKFPHGTYGLENYEDQGDILVGPGHPIIQIYRPQTGFVVQDDTARIRPADILPPPYVLGPSRNYDHRRNRRELILHVVPEMNGIMFHQVLGEFQIRIRIKDPLKPAAYWFEEIIEYLQEPPFGLPVIHSSNVYVQRSYRTVPDKKLSNVKSVRFPIGKVPELGPALDDLTDDLAAAFEENSTYSSTLDDDLQWEKALKELFITLADTVLGSLPVAGTIYDLGQLAYGAAYGKDFFGRKVEGTDMLVLGAGVLLPGALKLK